MLARKAAYRLHRWLALIISLQLFAWSLGGLLFSIFEIEEVRGETWATTVDSAPVDAESLQVSLRDALETLTQASAPPGEITAIALRNRGLGWFYEFGNQAGEVHSRVSCESGTVLPLLTRERGCQVGARRVLG